MALEPAGNLERSQRQRLFHRLGRSHGFLRYSYGYALPHRGFTRNDGTDNSGFHASPTETPSSYWKSNPYLTQRFTGESDSAHPQWIVVDLAQLQQISSIQIEWAEPYALHYVVQYWTGDDPIKAVTRGVWQTFPGGVITDGHGGSATFAAYARLLCPCDFCAS